MKTNRFFKKIRVEIILFCLLMGIVILPFVSSLAINVNPPLQRGEAPDVRESSSSIRASVDESLALIDHFSPNILLSTNDLSYPHHVEPTLAIGDDNLLFVAYKNAFTADGGGYRVSFVRSADGGNTWSTPLDMPMWNDMQTRQSDPWLVWFNDTLYFAYLEFTDDNTLSQITVAKSTDFGDSWTMASASNADGFADKETMVITSNGTIYLAYDDVVTVGQNDVVIEPTLSKSVDGGQTFTEVNVFPDAIDPNHVGPYLALSPNASVYVAWTWLRNDPWGDVFLDWSNDGGRTFRNDIDLNPNSENATYSVNPSTYRPMKITLPVMKFDQNGRLYVMWAGVYEPNQSWDVYLKYSDDLGLTWSPRIQVNPDTKGNQWMPDFDIDSHGRLHVGWYEEKIDSYRPYYRMIWFEGPNRDNVTMTDPIPIADASTSSTFTRPGDYFTIRVDKNDVPHVVWTDGRLNEMDILYAHGIYEEPTSEPTSTSSNSNESSTTSNETPSLITPFIDQMFLGAIILTLGLVALRKRQKT